MSDINFLTAGVIKLLSNAEVTFSQAGATDLPKTYSVPGLCTLNDRLLLFDMRHLIITNPPGGGGGALPYWVTLAFGFGQ